MKLAPMLMVQGTTSHAGKSVLTAGLCRIFARKGLRVLPYKSQNMALNSFVTPEGGEIGRAQAYQARAAGIEPHVDMNPILLKPNSETGSQVIVLGRVVGNMAVREYHAYQHTVWPVAAAALDRLRAQADLVIAEGAGSPAEINLRHRDIANMRVALHANCPVIIVADIDRGGVFASLIGTMQLLTSAERALVKGFVINKFRGDASLLAGGLDFLQKETGIPTLGVVPFLKGWKGDEEDSLGLESLTSSHSATAELTVAVVRLPFLANYTDFDAINREPDTRLILATRPEQLADADAILLPGTKSTLADLTWLKDVGFADALISAARKRVPVAGICGGYQMLGTNISDPHGSEAAAGSEVDGLALLSITTEFQTNKRTTRVSGVVENLPGCTGQPIHGYEIHMGATHSSLPPLLHGTDSQGTPFSDGAYDSESGCWGTYVHGIFDSAPFRRTWLNSLRTQKGLKPLDMTNEPEYDDINRLADHLETHLDLNTIQSWLRV